MKEDQWLLGASPAWNSLQASPPAACESAQRRKANGKQGGCGSCFSSLTSACSLPQPGLGRRQAFSLFPGVQLLKQVQL